MYIEFWTFKMKCTQYEICEQTTFKKTRTIFYGIEQDGQHLSFRYIYILMRLLGGARLWLPAHGPSSSMMGSWLGLLRPTQIA